MVLWPLLVTISQLKLVLLLISSQTHLSPSTHLLTNLDCVWLDLSRTHSTRNLFSHFQRVQFQWKKETRGIKKGRSKGWAWHGMLAFITQSINIHYIYIYTHGHGRIETGLFVPPTSQHVSFFFLSLLIARILFDLAF